MQNNTKDFVPTNIYILSACDAWAGRDSMRPIGVTTDETMLHAMLAAKIKAGDKKAKYFTATHKGTALITVLPEQVQSPLMTAEWEEKLKLVEHGELTADAFLSEIVGMTTALVKTYEMIKGADTLFPSDRESVGKCPRCGGAVTENKKGFCCSNKACGFAIWKENRFFTAKKKIVTKAIVRSLLESGKVPLTGCYSEKTGKTYDCVVALDDTGGQYVNFTMEFAAKKK